VKIVGIDVEIDEDIDIDIDKIMEFKYYKINFNI